MGKNKLSVTDDELVKAFGLWVSEFYDQQGVFEEALYEKQYKDMNYPEFAKEAFKYYIAKVQDKGEVNE